MIAAALAVAAAAAPDWKGAGRLAGRVTQGEGKPVEGATVALDLPGRGGGPSVRTDKEGRWTAAGLAAGRWTIDVSAAGLARQKMTVVLPAEGAPIPAVEMRLMSAAPPGPLPALVEALAKAEDAYKAERWADAVAHYERVLALRDDVSPTVHRQIGVAHVHLKNYPRALEHLQKVVDADPADVPTRLLMAQAALAGGLLDRALGLLAAIDDRAIRAPEAFYDIGVYFVNASQPAHAITYFTKAIALDAAYADAYFRRAMARLSVKQTEEAKADLRKVLELKPDGPQADAVRQALAQLK